LLVLLLMVVVVASVVLLDMDWLFGNDELFLFAHSLQSLFQEGHLVLIILPEFVSLPLLVLAPFLLFANEHVEALLILQVLNLIIKVYFTLLCCCRPYVVLIVASQLEKIAAVCCVFFGNRFDYFISRCRSSFFLLDRQFF
jgi:hypothetical protein